MSQNDNLPPLPVAVTHALFAGNSMQGSEIRPLSDSFEPGCAQYTAAQMQAYARAAIAVQADDQGEPVCWIDKQDLQVIKSRADRGVVDYTKHAAPTKTALFAHPAPARQPLTEDDIAAIGHRMASTYTHRSDPTSHAYGFVRHTLIAFARATEAAHGITAP